MRYNPGLGWAGGMSGVWAMGGGDNIGDVTFVSRDGDRVFRGPVEVVTAETVAQVCPALEAVARGVASGLHAAGFIAYEAAPAFDPALTTHPPDDVPLLWFGLYDGVSAQEASQATGEYRVGDWEPLVEEQEYRETVRRIRDLIAAGDTYQANYTFPMRARFQGDVRAWFRDLCDAQQADHCAFVDTGRFAVLSASPELFFRLTGSTLEARPMKGTRPRGRWPEEDRVFENELATSEKEQAENVMIVDLLRNDMGRVSRTGSVRVDRLFEVERYETLWQMTSSITSETDRSVPEVMTALFPSGSVTGAPKVRTMEIIRDLEQAPRGVYCGTIGWWAPDGRAEFNVAIRTVTVDRGTGTARYHVGSGITWGSSAEDEYAECRVKAALLTHRRPPFELLESLLWDGEYFLLEPHLRRLEASADYFGFPVDVQRIQDALLSEASTFGEGPVKVRLLVARNGGVHIESGPVTPRTTVRLGFAREPVDADDVFLYHKTTHREVYDEAKASRPDCDDVVLWNQDGELTETSAANVALRIDGAWLTPPVASGLLAGTMRAELLEAGTLREAVLTKDDVARTDEIRLVNSVSHSAHGFPQAKICWVE